MPRDLPGNGQQESVERTRLLLAIVEMAALFHDFGKATALFQHKLRRNKKESDPVRHEYLSCLLLFEIGELCKGGDAAWLSLMSTPVGASALVEEAFASLASRRRFALHGRRNASEFLFPRKIVLPEASKPLLRLIASIVLVHHRLAVGRLIEGEFCMSSDRHARPEDIPVDGLGPLLSQPRGIRPLWQEDALMKEIAGACEELSARAEAGLDDEVTRMGLVYGRLALMLGDHAASAVGSARSGIREKRLYANTSPERKMAEPLADHLISVRRHTRIAAMTLASRRKSLPSLAEDEIPDAIKSPSEPRSSKFRWQAEGAKAVEERVDQRDGSDFGFFALVLGRAGSGKTRAAVTVMSAASKGLRCSLALGSRSLLPQSADEYVGDLGFSKRTVSVLAGPDQAWRLYQADDKWHVLQRRSAPANEQQPLPEGPTADREDVGSEDVFPLGEGGTWQSERLPLAVERMVSARGRDRRLIASPLLISTVDALMPFADTHRDRHLPAALRVATSDLIVDAIDGWSDEDQAALAGLVFLAASFGRKVVISSSSIAPPVALLLFAAYREGYRLHAAIEDASDEVLCGWFSDVPDGIRVATVDSSDCFAAHHAEVTTQIAVSTAQEPACRRTTSLATWETPDDRAKPDTDFEAVGRHVHEMHAAHRLVDPVTGKGISVGLVQWSAVSSAWDFARHVLEKGVGPQIDCRVVPYHCGLLPIVRHDVDMLLGRMLNRRGEVDPLFGDPAVRAILDQTSSAEVVVLVAATPGEIVGRGYDFHWAICEPVPERSLAHLAGRVRRHREGTVSSANVSILEAERTMTEAHRVAPLIPSSFFASSYRDGASEHPANEAGLLVSKSRYIIPLHALMSDCHPWERSRSTAAEQTLVYDPDGWYGEIVVTPVERRDRFGRVTKHLATCNDRISIEKLSPKQESRLLPSPSALTSFRALSERLHSQGIDKPMVLRSLMAVPMKLLGKENRNTARYRFHPVLGFLRYDVVEC